MMEQKEIGKEELFSCLKSDGIEITDEEIQKARNKDGETQYAIGEKYYFNNKYKALAWYRLGAAQNISEAQFSIGEMYQYGHVVPQDYKQAMDWYLKAVNNDGNKEAQRNIGALYHHGYGVPKNIHTAIEWYTKAADQGYSNAQQLLGVIYEKEKEIKDLQQAVNWYKKAADNRYEYGKRELKRLNEQGYYPKEDAKIQENQEDTSQMKQSEDSSETRLESNDRAVSSDSLQEQLPLTNQNGENK